MTDLVSHEFDPAAYRAELDAFGALLAGKSDLSERDDIQPLFKRSRHLAAAVGFLFPRLGPADRVAFEFRLFGDYTADLVLGVAAEGAYCAVEFEDARPNSVFSTASGRGMSEWGRRFEHGFGQIVDWFYTLDDHRDSAGYSRHFGHGHVNFCGLLPIGRSAYVSDTDRRRLRWREERVVVNSHPVYCRTYDELHAALRGSVRLLSHPPAPPLTL